MKTSTTNRRRQTDREPLQPRLLRSTVMVLTYLVIEILAKVAVGMQLVHIVWKGHPSPWLRRRGMEFAWQMHGMWAYMAGDAAEAPWPFEPWPRTESDPRRAPVDGMSLSSSGDQTATAQ